MASELVFPAHAGYPWFSVRASRYPVQSGRRPHPSTPPLSAVKGQRVSRLPSLGFSHQRRHTLRHTLHTLFEPVWHITDIKCHKRMGCMSAKTHACRKADCEEKSSRYNGATFPTTRKKTFSAQHSIQSPMSTCPYVRVSRQTNPALHACRQPRLRQVVCRPALELRRHFACAH